MPFTNHDDVVKAFPANRANHPLDIRVLPRRAGRNDGLLDVQHPGLMRKSFSIDLVSVPNQIPGPSSSAHASSSWRAVHSAVGCSVTLKCTSRRRLWVSTTSTNRAGKVAVGTVKKSSAMRSGAWFFKNVRHASDGGLLTEASQPSLRIPGKRQRSVSKGRQSKRRWSTFRRRREAECRGHCH